MASETDYVMSSTCSRILPSALSCSWVLVSFTPASMKTSLECCKSVQERAHAYRYTQHVSSQAPPFSAYNCETRYGIEARATITIKLAARACLTDASAAAHSVGTNHQVEQW